MSYTHNDVAHNFAHDTGRCKAGFNMYYEGRGDGRTLYSYGNHFPIATFVRDPSGKQWVLLTSEGYSVSTAKHKTIARRALGYGREDVLEVPFLHANRQIEILGDAKAVMRRNREWCLEQAVESGSKFKRARVYKDMHAQDVATFIKQANTISKAWRLGFRDVVVPADIGAWADDAQAAHNAKMDRQRKAAAKRREQARLEQEARDKLAIRDWLNGEPVSPPHTRIPYVRVKGDMVETSWGIKVPLRQALAVYRFAKQVRRADMPKGCNWYPRKVHKIGGWMLDHVTHDGTIRAGCHVIPFKVSQKAAQLAGLESV